MKIKKMKKICYKSNFIRSPYIYKIIESGILNEEIKKIKHKKIQTSMYQTFKKGKTNTYELFLLNLDKFLMFLDINFIIDISEKSVILKKIFNNDKTRIFISTKDINSERDWYILQYKRLIVEKFYKTLNDMYENKNEVKEKLDKIINLKELTLENDTDELFDFLKDVINCSRENIHYLFYEYSKLTQNEIYLESYYEIFDNYNNRKDYLKMLEL